MPEAEAVTQPDSALLAGPGLLASLDPLLRRWLPGQRWFAGKGRPVTGFSLAGAVQLLPLRPARDPDAPGLLHLLVRAEQEALATPGAPADCYQLLLGVRAALPPHLDGALIGEVTAGPLAGRVVYEALHDPRLAEVLLEALRRRARIGSLRFERDADTEIGRGLTPRLLGAEQSNSSVVYGDTFILKLFRRIVPGINPDLELPYALARTACPRVPPPAAWFVAGARGAGAVEAVRGAPAGMRAGAGQVATGQLATGQVSAEQVAAEPIASGQLAAGQLATGRPATFGPLVLGVLQPYLKGATDGWQLALDGLARGTDFRAEARALGRATAEVHTALAAALPTVTLGRGQMERLAHGMAQRLDAAVRAVPELRPHACGLRSAYDALAAVGAGGGQRWAAQRIHGDLHLGQCLRAVSGAWSLIDFEGEPATPLAERCTPQPVVRDIAGMLRSFDYAARSHRPWAPAWAQDCRGAYCSGYAEVSGRDPRTEAVLLRAYETDKAVYEVLYEARHRPDWLPVPLAAIDRLARADAAAR